MPEEKPCPECGSAGVPIGGDCFKCPKCGRKF